MLISIVQKESPVLRQTSEHVPVSDILGSKIQKILAEMKTALDSQDDGVAIAAPQIGYPLRIFVISEKVAEILNERKNKNKKKKTKQSDLRSNDKTDQANEQSTPLEHTVFINPVIKKISKEKMLVEEGCLSVRYLYGKVKRSSKASVEARDEAGKKFVMGASGLLAQIFQHEIDHLNGVLFIDKAKKLEEIIPQK